MPARLRFEPSEGIWKGLKRLVSGELEQALTRLVAEPPEPWTALHETRKSIKRLRALLRLAERPLGKAHRKLDRQLASSARSLASAREADAAIEALDQLASRASATETEGFERARRAFVEAAPRRLLVLRALLLDARAELERVKPHVDQWPEFDAGFELVERGFRRTYRRARKALGQARRKRSAHAFHELRKAVKTHLHQSQYFESLWPEEPNSRSLALAELSTSLGEHHDLALLVVDLSQRGFLDLATRAGERNAALELQILDAAELLLSERARSLTARFGERFGELAAGSFAT